jgi:branched-chain amino acid transport system ATP-binding protein
MTAMLLETHDVSCRFGGLMAVAPLSFGVRAGTIKAVIGPNGAGKSTLFNLIAGVTRPTAGQITLDGARIDALPTFRRARLGLARTFQNLQIFRDMTALENVMAGLHGSGRAGLVASVWRSPAQRREEATIREAAAAALDRMGLGNRAHALARTLSFGQCKLLELARALVSGPRLLLLDEPAAGLPHAEVDRVTEIIADLRRGGMTVLLVEHTMRMVMALSDEILVLNHGQRIAEGDADAIRRHPEGLAAYLGDADDA